MKDRCLSLDHDDTVVNSTATVHYPSFDAYMKLYPPHYRCTLEEYFLRNFHGVVSFFRDFLGMTEEQILAEEKFWNDYVQKVTPEAYPGIRQLLLRQKQAGGLICVVSHSYTRNILRDYRENALPEPDLVFGWESPPQLRKPSPYPVERILERFDLRPCECLVVDDLKPGFDMARACGVPFAAAGWANDISEIEQFMRQNSDVYFKTVEALASYLFD